MTVAPVFLLAALLPIQVNSAPPEVCRPAPQVDAAATLNRAIGAIGLDSGDPLLHFSARDASAAREQSDRPYPPYLHLMTDREVWFSTATGVERHSFDDTWPGSARVRRTTILMSNDNVGMMANDSLRLMTAALPYFGKVRALNPWAVLLDWKGDSDLRVVGECQYRDYYRVVLERPSSRGPERMYFSTTSGLPVALAYQEPHELWGSMAIRYVYMNWKTVPGGGTYPGSAARLEDGESVIVRTVSGPSLRRLPADSATTMTLPPGIASGAATAPAPKASSQATIMADTVRVGPNTFVLANQAYNEVISLQRDTAFIFDATMSEARARGDSIWIARLFPRHRGVVLIVTDIAWPHIGGVRFWVARGATILTHSLSVPLLQQVTGRRWTEHPDALEASRSPRGTRLKARAINDSLTVAGGAITLIDVGGTSSEGALVAWLPADNFLWAGDYVQSVSQQTVYADDVNQALHRHHVIPVRFAAQHLPMTSWEQLAKVLGPAGSP